MFLQQKSIATWIRLGDDNTMYFYTVIKHGRLKKATNILEDEEGGWQSDPDVIAKLFVYYYKELLGKKADSRVKAFRGFLSNGSLLGKEQHVDLLKPLQRKMKKLQCFILKVVKALGSRWIW